MQNLKPGKMKNVIQRRRYFSTARAQTTRNSCEDDSYIKNFTRVKPLFSTHAHQHSQAKHFVNCGYNQISNTKQSTKWTTLSTTLKRENH